MNYPAKLALATLTDDELKTELVNKFPMARDNEIVATREQLEQAVLEIRKIMAA